MATEKNGDAKTSTAKAESLLDELIEELGLEPGTEGAAKTEGDKVEAKNRRSGDGAQAGLPDFIDVDAGKKSDNDSPVGSNGDERDANMALIDGMMAEGRRTDDDDPPSVTDDLVDDIGFQPKKSRATLLIVILISLVGFGGVIGYMYQKDPDLFKAFFTGRIQEYKNREARRKREQMIADHLRKRKKYGTLTIMFAPEDADVTVFKDGLQLAPPKIAPKKLAKMKTEWEAAEKKRRDREDELLKKKKATQAEIDKLRGKRKFRAVVKSPHTLKNLLIEAWKGEQKIIHKYRVVIKKQGYETAQIDVLRRSWTQRGDNFEKGVTATLKMTPEEKERQEKLKKLEKEEKEKNKKERKKLKKKVRKKKKKKK